MPRYRRQIVPGSVQHVISRFVDREFRFDVPGARAEYLRRAARGLAKSDWRAMVFGLMSSHVHWGFRAGESTSATLIKPLHVGFAAWLNAAEERLGPVFAERHRSLTFEGATAAALLAYIHNNPVRAGVVDDPSQSSWTSHRYYLGLAPAPPWLDVALGLHLCGFSSTPSGRLAFHEMVCARSREPRSQILSGSTLADRRRLAREDRGGPVEIGAPAAIATTNGFALHVPVLTEPACLQRPRWVGDATCVLRTIEQATAIESDELLKKGRSRLASAARRVALLVWTHELNRPAIEMARALGLSSSSAAGLVSSASPSARRVAASIGASVWKNVQEARSGVATSAIPNFREPSPRR